MAFESIPLIPKEGKGFSGDYLRKPAFLYSTAENILFSSLVLCSLVERKDK